MNPFTQNLVVFESWMFEKTKFFVVNKLKLNVVILSQSSGEENKLKNKHYFKFRDIHAPNNNLPDGL